MPLNLGVDDKTLLDVASQPRSPRTTRQQRSGGTGSSSRPGSTKLTAGSSNEEVAEFRLGAAYMDAEDDEEAEEDDDDDDDSASIYQDSNPTPSSHHQYTVPNSSSSFSPPAQSQSQSQNSSSAGHTTTAPPNKRGRKPAPAASRGAREQARKTNHSRIEKRRREKINEALATLREIVPVGISGILEHYGYATTGNGAGMSRSPSASPALSAVGAAAAAGIGAGGGDNINGVGGAKKKGGAEKEFKLEVLERTVVFVKYLLERVNELESRMDATSSDGTGPMPGPANSLNLPPPLLAPPITTTGSPHDPPPPADAFAVPSSTTTSPSQVRKRRRQDSTTNAPTGLGIGGASGSAINTPTPASPFLSSQSHPQALGHSQSHDHLGLSTSTQMMMPPSPPSFASNASSYASSNHYHQQQDFRDTGRDRERSSSKRSRSSTNVSTTSLHSNYDPSLLEPGGGGSYITNTSMSSSYVPVSPSASMTTVSTSNTPYIDASSPSPWLSSSASNVSSPVLGPGSTADGNGSGSRPRLPSIAAMLNISPTSTSGGGENGTGFVASPSLLPSNNNAQQQQGGAGGMTSLSLGAPSIGLGGGSGSVSGSGSSSNSSPQSPSALIGMGVSVGSRVASGLTPSTPASGFGTISTATSDGGGNTYASTHARHATGIVAPPPNAGMPIETDAEMSSLVVEDEETAAAASLLMHFSHDRDREHRRSANSTARNNGHEYDQGVSARADGGGASEMAAHTPGSLLGLGPRRG
ncbi:hypothetical protein DL93DRAFT_1806341 [Clavulina sp. PMI_390]|nr:hypothetical protein DL93DRAFT_1806341 [Clavulina sp. PMI_390]